MLSSPLQLKQCHLATHRSTLTKPTLLKKFTVDTVIFVEVTAHDAVGHVGLTATAGCAVVVIGTPIVTIGDATSTDTMAAITVRATTIAAVVASEST